MLDARNIKTRRPNKFLNYKNLGLYKIIRAIDNLVYELALPPSIKGIFLVFYLSLLYLDNSDPLPGQIEPPPSSIVVDEEGAEYNVLEILDSKINNRRKDPVIDRRGYLMYKFRYTGYNSDNTILE